MIKSNEWKLESGDLWFKGENGGPYRYDGNKLYWLTFPKNKLENEYYKQYPATTINPYDIYYIYEDTKRNVWFGTGSLGIYRFDGTSLSCLYEEHLTQIRDGGSFGIRSIIQDRKGRFWFCNTKYRYQVLPRESIEKGKDIINYIRETGIENVKDSLGHDRIYYQTIVEDSNGNLRMQTYMTGVWKYNGKKLSHYPVKDGTESVKIISMYKDRYGILWLATQEKGVYKFNGKTFEKFRMSG